MPAHIKPAAVAAVPQPQQSLVQRLFAGLGSSELQSALQSLAATIEGNPDIAQKYLNLAQQAQTSGYYDQLNKRGNKKLQIAEDAATAKLAKAAEDAQFKLDAKNAYVSMGIPENVADVLANVKGSADVFKGANTPIQTTEEEDKEKRTTTVYPFTGKRSVVTTESAQGAREAKSKEAQSRFDQREGRQAAQAARNFDLDNKKFKAEQAQGGGFSKPPSGYLYNDDGALRPISGGPGDPYRAGSDLMKERDNKIANKDKAIGAFDALGADIKEHGTETIGAGSARQQAIYKNAQNQLRTLSNTGVLNVGELPFLEEFLADPTKVMNSYKAPYVLEQLDVIRGMVNAAHEADMRQYENPNRNLTPEEMKEYNSLSR